MRFAIVPVFRNETRRTDARRSISIGFPTTHGRPRTSSRHARIKRLQSGVVPDNVYSVERGVLPSAETRGIPEPFVALAVRNENVVERNTIHVDHGQQGP